MPWPRALLALLLVLSSGPAWAVKDWYDFYEEGKLQAGRGLCKEALANLAQARRLKPGSELQARLYGLVFVDYVPYFYEGMCHVKMGDFKTALKDFEAEEKQGVIQKKRELHADLAKLRAQANKALEDAAAAEREKKARALLEELQRLRKEGDDLYRQGKLDDAQKPLVEAQKIGAWDETLAAAARRRRPPRSGSRRSSPRASSSSRPARARRRSSSSRTSASWIRRTRAPSTARLRPMRRSSPPPRARPARPPSSGARRSSRPDDTTKRGDLSPKRRPIPTTPRPAGSRTRRRASWKG